MGTPLAAMQISFAVRFMDSATSTVHSPIASVSLPPSSSTSAESRSLMNPVNMTASARTALRAGELEAEEEAEEWRLAGVPPAAGDSSGRFLLLAELALLPTELTELALLSTELALVSDMVLVFASTFGSVLSSTLSSAFAAVPPLRPLLPPGSGRAGGAVVFPALAPRPRFTAPLGDTDLAASTLALYIAVSDTVTDRSMPEGAATLPE